MNTRVHPDNPLWVLCCCGGLPVLGILKGLLFFAPPTIYTTLATTATAIIFLPHNAYLITKLTYTTVLLGRNLRFLLLVLLPFAFVVWLPFVFFVSFLCSILYNFFSIAKSVFDVEQPLLSGGVCIIYKANNKFVCEFWKMSSESILHFVDETSYIPRGWDGERYEIPLIKVFIGAILAIYGAIVGLLIASVIVVVKFLPLLIRANVEYSKLQPECHWIPFWVIGWVLMNVLSPIGAALGVLYGLLCGVACPMEALASDSIASGFWQVFRMMRDFDIFSTDCILADSRFAPESTPSCIPKPPPSPSDRGAASRGARVAYAHATTGASLEVVYSRFLTRCSDIALNAVEQGEIKLDHLKDAEPFVILGIPAVALLDILIQDKKNMNNDTTIQCSNMEIKRSVLERDNGVVDVFWPKLMAIRKHIVRHNLSAADIAYIRFQSLAGGAAQEEMTEIALEMKNSIQNDDTIDVAKLNCIVSDLNSFSIDASRLRFMVERFQAEVLAVVAQTP